MRYTLRRNELGGDRAETAQKKARKLVQGDDDDDDDDDDDGGDDGDDDDMMLMMIPKQRLACTQAAKENVCAFYAILCAPMETMEP